MATDLDEEDFEDDFEDDEDEGVESGRRFPPIMEFARDFELRNLRAVLWPEKNGGSLGWSVYVALVFLRRCLEFSGFWLLPLVLDWF